MPTAPDRTEVLKEVERRWFPTIVLPDGRTVGGAEPWRVFIARGTRADLLMAVDVLMERAAV